MTLISLAGSDGIITDVTQDTYSVDFRKGYSDFGPSIQSIEDDEQIRSITMSSEHSIVVGLDKRQYIRVNPGESIRVAGLNEEDGFTTLSIRVGLITNLQMVASTDPQGSPERVNISTFTEGNPFFRSGTIDGGTETTFEVREGLGRNANNGVIRNQDSQDLLRMYSRSGPTKEFVGPREIRAKTTQNISGRDIYEIKIEAPQSDVEYEVDVD